MSTADPVVQKSEVQQFWESEPCGSRYLVGVEAPRERESTIDPYDLQIRARYGLEPFIWDFAKFASGKRRKVLEVGVGMGADFVEWLKAGAHATGIDLSETSIRRARQRCQSAGFTEPDLRVADAENLPFADETFDIVYSYGVMHHSPDTHRCIREAWRVLKPGGEAKIMIYHHPSLTGIMLWVRYGIWRGRSMHQCVYAHLESPGTKTYTKAEAAALMSGFCNVEMKLAFSPGDLLVHRPSSRFRGALYRFFWRLYPRWLLRRIAGDCKLFLLLTGKKEG